MLNVPAVFFVASAFVAAADRSFAAGLQATAWALMVTFLSTFAIFWVLIAMPALAFPCGVVGAGLGAIGTTARDSG